MSSRDKETSTTSTTKSAAGRGWLGMSSRRAQHNDIDVEAIVIPLAADADIVADLRAGVARRLLDKILDGLACRHRWDLVVPHPTTWNQWDFVSYRTQMPDLGVFRRRIANTLQCGKCGSELDVSDWDEASKFFEIGRRYHWMSKVYFELLLVDQNKQFA